ncbi:MAG: 1-acyl-sn-glycerol-3-phosphate acyltransferase [Firmicutes bacterium]|nr:1-acyl-sn-glycerol-3-phosphate acyltransferase [Bacillota bacterium]
MIKLLYYAYFGVYMLVMTTIGAVNTFFLRRKSVRDTDEYVYRTARKMVNHFMKISDSKMVVKGLENIPEGACVFVSNHQAIFDVFLLMSNIDKQFGFIAKKEIRRYPFIGFWINAIHSVFMDRSNVREGMKSINEGVERIKQGYSLVIFPEGTRSLKSQMAPFHKGSMKLAVKAGAPIVPITLDGTYKVLETGNQVRGHVMNLIVHKPVMISGLSEQDRRNLSDTVYNTIKNGLEELKD